MKQVSRSLGDDGVAQGPDPAPFRATVLLSFLAANVLVAACYGATFLLPQYLAGFGMAAARSGTTIALGVVPAMAGCLLAGPLATRVGAARILAASAAAAGASSIALAGAALHPLLAALGVGILGFSWATFFVLAPVRLVHSLRAEGRLRHLLLVSAAQMVGVGAAPTLGQLTLRQGGSLGTTLVLIGVGGLFAAISLAALGGSLPAPSADAQAWPGHRALVSSLRGRPLFPLAMIVLSAGIFATLSTFQVSYARSRGVDPDVFFATFTLVCVLLRFAFAPFLDRVDLASLVLGLVTLTAVGVLCMCLAHTATGYLLACVVFATGYSLSFSSLNAMALSLAGGVPLTLVTQIFTLAYFAGSFTFPALGGWTVDHLGGVDAMLISLVTLASINLAVALGARLAPSPRSADGA